MKLRQGTLAFEPTTHPHPTPFFSLFLFTRFCSLVFVHSFHSVFSVSQTVLLAPPPLHQCVVALNKPLLSAEQEVLVNPLIVTFHRAEHLPATPVPYRLLDSQCERTHLRFKFFGDEDEEVVYARNNHSAVATFNHRLVILTGLLDREDFAYWLEHNQGLHVEVHDRKRRPKQVVDDTGMFGQKEGEDLKTGAANFNRVDAFGRDVDGAGVGEEEEAWDPFGVATVQLRAVLLGTKKMKLSTPILPCQQREVQRFSLAKGRASRAMHPGHYISAGSTLEVTVELMHPRRFDEDVDDGDMLIRAGIATEQEIRKRRKKASIRSVTVPRPASSSRPPTTASTAARALRSGVSSAATDPSTPATRVGTAASERSSSSTAPNGVADTARAGLMDWVKRPYGRMVIVCRPHFVVWVAKLRNLVHDLNVTTLELDRCVCVLCCVFVLWCCVCVLVCLCCGVVFVCLCCVCVAMC